jgi:hypothetical protein
MASFHTFTSFTCQFYGFTFHSPFSLSLHIFDLPLHFTPPILGERDT